MSKDITPYRITFYDIENNKLLSYYSYGAPNISRGELIKLQIVENALEKTNQSFIIRAIQYIFYQPYYGYTDVTIEIVVEKFVNMETK